MDKERYSADIFTNRRTKRRPRKTFIRSKYITVLLLSMILLFGGLIVVQAQSMTSHPSNPIDSLEKSVTASILARWTSLPFAMSLIESKDLIDKPMEWLTGVQLSDPKSYLTSQIPVLPLIAHINEKVLTMDGALLSAEGEPHINEPPPDGGINPGISNPAYLVEPVSTQDTFTGSSTNKKVLIYHTHNRESYIPWLKDVKDPNRAYDPSENITLVGRKLGEQLELKGIGTIVSTTDYTPFIPKYQLSYQYSDKVIKRALSQYNDIQYVFDLHRDSLPKKETTVIIDDKAYARISIVVGGKNPNWQKNYQFGEQFRAKAEELYPGITSSVNTKKAGNGEYNQSLFERSLLIEIGGVENTKQEVFRTTEALAEIIASMVEESQAVQVKAETEKDNKQGGM